MRLALALAPMLLATTLPAQEEEWYTVELIAFERAGDGGLHAELWPAAPSFPDLSSAIELLDAGELSPVESASAPGAPAMPRAFQRLEREELELDGVRERLERSQLYRVLLHIAWRQPGFAVEEAKVAHVRNANAALGVLRETGDAPRELGMAPFLETDWSPPAAMLALDDAKPALDGTVRLHRARYLHVLADLVYYRPGPGAGEARAATTDASGAEPLPRESAAPTLFRLRESRRMRSGELHYFDHPLFGLIVQVRPYELPFESLAPESGAGTSAEDSPAPPSAGGG